jgi:tripartite-type tricarboxylate transporter receptor subunit TctC
VLPFDYMTAFVPVTQISSFPQVIAVKQDFPARNLAEFIAVARTRPNSISVGTPPAAGMAHLALAAFMQQAGIIWSTRPIAAALMRRGTSWWARLMRC